jgi:hypothetical protein
MVTFGGLGGANDFVEPTADAAAIAGSSSRLRPGLSGSPRGAMAVSGGGAESFI